MEAQSCDVPFGRCRPPDASEEQRVIVLLGPAGSGKSSTGNSILGQSSFVTSCGFDPPAANSSRAVGSVCQCQLTVLDTPGISGGSLRRMTLFTKVMDMIREVDPGPHTLVFVVRLGRVLPADAALLRLLPQLLGPDTCRFCTVVFTHGDELKDKSIKNLIRSNQDVAELVSACGGRFCVFDNMNSRKRQQQVRDLLRSIDQIYEANGGSCFTSEMMKKRQPTVYQRLFDALVAVLKHFGVM